VPACVLVYVFTLLWLHRVACLGPCLEPAEDRSDFFIAVVKKDERRTGARVLIQSGAVGDDPLILAYAGNDRVRFNIRQR